MNRKVLLALAVLAAIIIFLIFRFYSGGLPFKKTGKPLPPAAKSQVAPAPQEKPGAKPPPGPSPAPSPQVPPAPGASPAPAPSPVTKPEAPPAPKETALPPLEPKEEQGVLLGTFRTYAFAKKLLEQMKKEGRNAFIKKKGKRYQVWVGPFATRQEAAKAAKAVKAKNKVSPRIEKVVTPVPK
jgi:cell division septation protein DedD